MPLSAAGSALVAGSSQESTMQAQQQQQPQVVNARVLRSFYFGGKATKVGDILELPRVFALEMRAAHKVEFVQPKAEASPEPKKPEARAPQKGLV